MENPVVLFDGVCNLCNGSVQFIIKRDRKRLFRFAALQSEAGRQLMQNANLSSNYFDSIVLVQEDKAYVNSTAVLRIAKMLPGLWKLAYIFIIVPRPLRDAVYRFVANHRYKWFGKKDQCMIPTPELKELFL